MASGAPAEPSEPRRRSPIAGRGLFSPSGHGVGEIVLVFDHDILAVDDLGPVNHSCDPNLGFTDGRSLVTLRDVPADAEFTVDYATALTDPDFVLWCHCETYRCRQVVEGGDWRIPQLQTRYAGHWAPAAQALIDAQ